MRALETYMLNCSRAFVAPRSLVCAYYLGDDHLVPTLVTDPGSSTAMSRNLSASLAALSGLILLFSSLFDYKLAVLKIRASDPRFARARASRSDITHLARR